MFTFLIRVQNEIQKVPSYIHGLPDNTWKEPDPEDPLSLVDQVSFADSLLFEKHFTCWKFLKGGAGPRLPVRGEDRREETAAVHPLQQGGQRPDHQRHG